MLPPGDVAPTSKSHGPAHKLVQHLLDLLLAHCHVLIVMSSMLRAATLTTIHAFPLACSNLQLNAAFLAAAAYSLYYLCLEPVAGLSWTTCVGLPLWVTATMFQQQVRLHLATMTAAKLVMVLPHHHTACRQLH
jgi:uncharacterized membrane protein YGL010W